MRFSITLLLALALSLSAWAQPNYFTTIQRVAKGRKATYYNTQATKLQKRGAFNQATINAAHSLSISVNKRQIRKAQEILRGTHSRAVRSNLDRISSLKAQTESFQGDKTVTQLAEIVRLYKYMETYNQVLLGVPKKSFRKTKSKDQNLELELRGFANEVSEAESKLATGINEAAEMHYQNGIQAAKSGTIPDSKRAYRYYTFAMQYLRGYKDAEARKQAAQKAATTRMGIVRFEDKTGLRNAYGDLAEAVTDELVAGLFNNSSYRNLKFFELISRDELDRILEEQRLSVSGLLDESSAAEVGNLKGVHVLLLGKVTTTHVTTSTPDPHVYNVERVVVVGKEKYTTDDGKTAERDVRATVKATYTEYYKQATAEVGGSYRIIEVETGKIIKIGTETGSFTWQDSWAKYTGDKRALSNTQQRKVAKKEPGYPSKGSLLTQANKAMAGKLTGSVLDYAKKKGN